MVAGELGFEPRQTESESVVLPLHHSPSKWLTLHRFFGSFAIGARSFANPAICSADIAGPAFVVQSSLARAEAVFGYRRRPSSDPGLALPFWLEDHPDIARRRGCRVFGHRL